MEGSATGGVFDEIEAGDRRRLSEFRRVAAAIIGSREGGDDAVQDAFANAVHRRDQFRGEGTLDAWLWRIVVHAARDAGARVARPSSMPFEEGLGTTAATGGHVARVGRCPRSACRTARASASRAVPSLLRGSRVRD